jgi:hypothetical protein
MPPPVRNSVNTPNPDKTEQSDERRPSRDDRSVRPASRRHRLKNFQPGWAKSWDEPFKAGYKVGIFGMWLTIRCTVPASP